MNFKKFKGQIYKVEFTPKEQRAMEAEINRQLIETHRMFTDDFDYMVLRVLHNHFGFGLKRLRKAYDLFREDNDALVKHYEMPEAGAYIARKEMNAIGCNVEQWNRERGE